ncbi:MAG TPA: efflux RND transporter periplasmic adaptor subunit [Polyangiaceae bacterium]|nr:efflux RND transporter periplasmic adaptor subunit [Polyangiaceae bacterium]
MDDRLGSDLASLRIDRKAAAPSSGRALKWVAGALIVVAVALAAWKMGAPAVEARVFKTEVVLTEVSVVSPAQAQVRLTATGYVVPQLMSDVSSKVVGRVTRREIDEGAKVKTGQVLFLLDPTDQRAAIVSAQARVASAKARAATARAQLSEVVLQRDRERRLADTGAVAAATADDLAARAKSLEEQVHAADAEIAAAQAEVNVATENLANMTIRAEMDGTVVVRNGAPGDIVTPGTALARIADLDSILVEADVPEGRLHLVTKAQPTEIVLDAYPDKRWRGEVVTISPQLNRAKATATVKVRFLDRDDTVLPEMAARISFLDAPLDVAKLKEPPKTVMPASAVADRGGAKVVFTVDDGKVRMVPVVLGAPFAGGFELTSGPAPGTKLVSDPPATMADGQTIKERSP